jgi:hypothetical protein
MGILNDEQVAVIRGELPTETLIRERKEKDAARKRQERKVKRLQKDAELLRTESEWHAKNREALTATELAAMQEKDEYIRSLLYSMRTINAQELDSELLDTVLDFVKQNPCPHLGYAHIGGLNSQIAPDWSSRPYWQDPKLIALLEAEGPATASRARYGYLTSIPDWLLIEFLTKKAGWSWDAAAKLVGYKVVNGVVGYEAAP